MKFFIHLILFLLPFFANAQLERTWIAVESKQVTTDFISPLDGTIFDFRSNDLIIRNTFSDTTITHDYRLENDKVLLNDSSVAVIKHLSKDSLLLEFNNWMLTVFYPIKFQHPVPELTDEYLLNNTWTLNFDDRQESWNFTNIEWNMFQSDESKVAIQREGDTEKWNLTVFEDYVLLTLTMGQFDKLIYQVVEVNGDSIRLRPINKWLIKDVNFIKSTSSSKEQLKDTQIILTDRIWKITEIIESRSSSEGMIELMQDEIDSIDINLFKWTGSYASWVDTLLISEQQFNNKLISYQFNDDLSYCILLSNKKYSCGTWQLLHNGRTIKLDKGVGVEQYIDIIDLTNSHLIISNSNQFAVEPGSNEYNVIYYTVKLE